jgi:hypothetical protein
MFKFRIRIFLQRLLNIICLNFVNFSVGIKIRKRLGMRVRRVRKGRFNGILVIHEYQIIRALRKADRIGSDGLKYRSFMISVLQTFNF